MQIFNTAVPGGGSTAVKIPFKKSGIRRVILVSPYNNINLKYDGKIVIRSTSLQSLYEIKFESYYGYPDSELFSLTNGNKNSVDVTILADTVPYAPINSDYFETVTNPPPLNSDPVDTDLNEDENL